MTTGRINQVTIFVSAGPPPRTNERTRSNSWLRDPTFTGGETVGFVTKEVPRDPKREPRASRRLPGGVLNEDSGPTSMNGQWIRTSLEHPLAQLRHSVRCHSAPTQRRTGHIGDHPRQRITSDRSHLGRRPK